jgi:hypothetical protein
MFGDTEVETNICSALDPLGFKVTSLAEEWF